VARIGFSNEAQSKIFAQNIYSPVRIEFSRSLFTILQNKPSEIDVSIKKITTKN